MASHSTLPTHPHRWFHGKISGQEAIQQLQPPEDGLFLVRESARHPGDYVLCVSFGRDVIHYRVLHRDGHLTIDEAVCFCNLMDMVEVTCGGGWGGRGGNVDGGPQQLSFLSLELGSPPQGALSFHSNTPHCCHGNVLTLAWHSGESANLMEFGLGVVEMGSESQRLMAAGFHSTTPGTRAPSAPSW